VTKRLSAECREFIIAKLNTWPITTRDLQRACREAGYQTPTYEQIVRIERWLNKPVEGTNGRVG